MIDAVYFRQAELLLRVLPLVDREAVFALKGGTAINFFVRDLPRVSVDIDLVYLPVGEHDLSLREISAALDRQHPRDLFDVLMLLREGTFNDAMRKAFIVYLISHDRPMVEVLDPGFADIRPVFEAEFRDMTLEEVTCEDLERTREQLVSMIARELTIQERQFIVSIKEGIPQWDLIGLEGVQNLPDVQWKLLNIGRMAPAKHQQALRKLRDYLRV